MKRIKQFIFAVGAFKISTYLYSFAYEIYARNFREPYNLLERYGSGTYALVTGSTDGIGKSYARELARRGFNIVLVARNEEKLNKVKAEIESEFGVNVRVIKYDFLRSTDYASLLKIDQVTRDLDVSLLVNNVGISTIQAFTDLEPQEINEILVTNIFPMTFLTHAFARRFLKRSNKSAIINVGTENGEVPFPYMQIYSGTKSYNNHFTESLQGEDLNQIDILLHAPGYTRTNIGSKLKQKIDSSALRRVESFEKMIGAHPDDSTRAVLNSLGYDKFVAGTVDHTIALELTKMLSPISIWGRGYFAKQTINFVKKHAIKDESPST